VWAESLTPPPGRAGDFTQFIRPKAFFWRGANNVWKLSWTTQYPPGLKAASSPEWIVDTSLWYQWSVGRAAGGSGQWWSCFSFPFLHNPGHPRHLQGLAHCPMCWLFSTFDGLSWTEDYINPKRKEKQTNKEKENRKNKWLLPVQSGTAMFMCLGLFDAVKCLFKSCLLLTVDMDFLYTSDLLFSKPVRPSTLAATNLRSSFRLVGARCSGVY
jgi:hypothetical protein